MLLKFKIFGLFIFIICIFCGCKTVKIDAEAPDRVPFTNQTFQPKISLLSVPINFPVKQLENRLNTEFAQLVYKDDNITDDNVAYTITRAGKINITAENNLLYLNLPLHIWVKGAYSWKACDFCPTLSAAKATEFDVTLRAQSSISFTENWQIKTLTSIKYDWGKQKPSLELGPISIPLNSLIDFALKPQIANISNQLDKEIQNRLDLKSYVQKAWIEVQQPLLVDETYKAWLVIKPVEVKITPVIATLDQINLKVGISSFVDVVTGQKPVVQVNRNLPKLLIDNNLQNDFQIGIMGEMSYAHASEMLKRSLIGEVFFFEEGKYKVTINDINLYGSGDKLHIKVNINAQQKKNKPINGNVFLSGIPYFDTVTSSVRMRNLQYDVKSKNVLAKAASWMLKIGFDKKVQEFTYFPLGDYIKDAKEMLQQGLDENGKLTDNVFLKGNISALQPENIYLLPTSFKTVILAKGNLQLLIDKL